MGDSGAEDTSDSLTDADLDQIAADAEAIQEGPKSNIVGSSSYDAQFTADQLAGRGLDPQGFMAPENFAQTTQGGFTGGTGPQETTINVPSVQAADTTPTFSAAGVSDVFDPMTMRSDTPSQTMVEALGTPSMMPANVSRETVVDNTPLGLARSMLQDVQGLKGTTSGLLDAINFGTGTGRGIDTETPTRSLDPRGIDFGVTAPLNTANITETALGARTPGTRTTDQILADQSRMQQGQIPSVAEDPFDPNVGKPFDVGRLEQMERLQEPTLLERAGLPSALTALDPERMSRDRMATAIALGRPVGPIEGFTFTAPDMTKDKETIEQFNQRISARIPDNQLIKDGSGMVIGIKDASGRLVEGVDPNAQMQQGDSEEVKKAQPKAPTDPCPEGYQLIDGKCTLMEKPVDEGTGFIRFPTDRTPPFETGPFTPKTVATNPINITPLNPVTFRLSDIFKT